MPTIISVYLGGPMRGFPRYNFDAFEKAMIDLESKGLKVISPHKMDLDLGFDPSHEGELKSDFVNECVRRDIDAIIKTEGCVFLPGWEDSVGATAEYAVAKWLQRPCLKYPDLEPIHQPANENVLEEANRIVHGARQASYGHPKNDFQRTAKIWEAILGIAVKPAQVALCMIGVKMSRECNAHKRDTVVDIAGYAGTLAMLYDE